MSANDNIIKSSLQFWQKRTSRKLTEEDAREISETLYNFVQILLDWNREDNQRQAQDINNHSR